MSEIAAAAEQLQQLYRNFYTQGKPDEATHQQLLQIYKNPSNIEIMIHLAKNTNDLNVKKLAYTGITAMTKQNKNIQIHTILALLTNY